MSNIGLLISAISAVGLGLYTFRVGWLIIKHGHQILAPPTYISLWILRNLRGEEAARSREAELKRPQAMQLAGWSALFVGVSLSLSGVMFFIALLLQLSAIH